MHVSGQIRLIMEWIKKVAVHDAVFTFAAWLPFVLDQTNLNSQFICVVYPSLLLFFS